MNQSKLKSKRMMVGALIVGAFGGIALRIAWATPNVGLTTTIISGPVALDEIHLNSQGEAHDVKIKTNGVSDVYVVHNRIVPGGHTGWHSHPGPSIISVVSGQATDYHDDDPNGTVHAAGTAFVDAGTHKHRIVNEGETDLVLVAFQILPVGAPRRIDEPAP